jgi:hypothetical protein
LVTLHVILNEDRRPRRPLKAMVAIWYNHLMRDEKTARWLAAQYELIADQMMRDAEAQKKHSEAQHQQSAKNAVAFYDIARKILRDIPPES